MTLKSPAAGDRFNSVLNRGNLQRIIRSTNTVERLDLRPKREDFGELNVADQFKVILFNNSGTDFKRWQPVTIDETFPEATNAEMFENGAMGLSGYQFAAGDMGMLAVTLEPIASGQSGWAMVGGLLFCSIEVPTNWAWCPRCGPAASKDTLVCQPQGPCAILAKQSGEGGLVRAAVFVQQPHTIKYRGVANATITAGSSGAVQLKRRNFTPSTSCTVTAYLDWAENAEDVSSGKEVFVDWMPEDGVWQITGAECEA